MSRALTARKNRKCKTRGCDTVSHLYKKRKEVYKMESKRMAGDYTIILSTTTLTGECVIGENINAKPGFEYGCRLSFK